MKKFVWDTSAIINIKEPNSQGYSPGYSLFKDLNDGWIPGPYQNIFPAVAVFEVEATVSKMHRKKKNILREFRVINDNSIIYPVDLDLIQRSSILTDQPGFSMLQGADLIFACIAHLEDAYLVTLDNHFEAVTQVVKVVNLNSSRDEPNYRGLFGI
jgi:predicted nucleic acid-binding protein